ncbi:hypothetical protein N7466_005812 [Penicillium verhagenii]|uniref:uncharacterized protein n=1 Tax=Penicillium verhagenii TaxID=1562060 RepID=UPI002544E973|nr:uncharacterized protein N7466_005812 [Penicillium verhagenii]KAJ5930319.1 hypothetical protein N7466_005812 [Penicillium verhagenii]
MPDLWLKYACNLHALFHYFTRVFDFNISANSFPLHDLYETKETARPRTQIVSRLVGSVYTLYGHAGNSWKNDINELRMLKLGTTMMFWYINSPSAAKVREAKEHRNKRRSLEHYDLGDEKKIVHTTLG